MQIKKLEIVRFAPKGKDSFMDAVKTAVNEYFESNRISTYANAEMWVKTAVMLALYFVPCTLMITGVASGHPLLFFGCWFIMGIGMTGIGTSVMHDANHGAYSANKKVNNFIGHVLELIGGYVANWKIQHNILHHTYTNIEGLDEDIHSIKLLRFSPSQPRYWYHRYQHIYAWFFYMIMTLFWMTVKDYIAVFRYKKHDLLVKQKVTLKTAILRISLAKVFYYSYILVLPILFSGMHWYMVLAGFFVMHFVAGLFLACIFQPAHVIGESTFSKPVEGGKMEDSWAVHEVANTSNFAPRSRILSWFIGGLNYQIEHHLFSDVCHVHYRKLAPIVKSITTSFKIPYNVQANFVLALWAHGKMLKQLGREG